MLVQGYVGNDIEITCDIEFETDCDELGGFVNVVCNKCYITADNSKADISALLTKSQIQGFEDDALLAALQEKDDSYCPDYPEYERD